MRLRWVLWAVCGFSWPLFAGTPECRDLSSENRKAIQQLVDFRYSQPSWPIPYEGNDERKIVAQLKMDLGKALPCLEKIFQTDPKQAGFWPYSTPAPKDGQRMLTAIEKVDPKTGIKMHRAMRAKTRPDSKERLENSLSLARLGDVGVLGDICRFLNDPSFLGPQDREATRDLVPVAVRILTKHNYRPALAILRRLATERPSDSSLKLATAQIGGELELVRLYTFDPGMHGDALRALLRMGRRDIVEKLADDPQFPFRDAAFYLLKNPDE